MEIFLVRNFPYSVQMRENTDQKKLRMWTIFTQCTLSKVVLFSYRIELVCIFLMQKKLLLITEFSRKISSVFLIFPENRYSGRNQEDFFCLGFLSRTFTIHRAAGEEGGRVISLTLLYHFHPLHRHLDISRAITAQRSHLHTASNRTRTGSLWFPSASR